MTGGFAADATRCPPARLNLHPRTCATSGSTMCLKVMRFRARRATIGELQCILPIGVSTHARARRATTTDYFVDGVPVFQPTLARGERLATGRSCTSSTSMCFNPRSRAASDIAPAGYGADPDGFNPRSRAASDLKIRNEMKAREWFVSTHARARRATYRYVQRSLRVHVSTHARARRATASRPACRPGVPRFNPRSRAASDVRILHRSEEGFRCFNPRSRAASDIRAHRPVCGQSGFNPRSRAASDIFIAL